LATPASNPQDGFREGVTNLRDYLQVLRRRRWLVIATVALVGGAALAHSLTQTPVYQGSAEVLLSRQNLANALTNTNDPTANAQDFDRIAQTQADLATAPTVADRTVQAVGLPMSERDGFQGNAEVKAKPNADILVFRVRNTDPVRATKLTNEYARQYTIYRGQLDTNALVKARQELKRKLDQLLASGQKNPSLVNSLNAKDQQLSTLEALQTAYTFVTRQSGRAAQISPLPVRATVVGIILGLLLGVIIAFLREALDTRVRNAEEISEKLGLPLLSRIPEPPRRLRQNNELVMLKKPSGQHAEAFRVLRTNIEFANIDRAAKTIMFTSAVQSEGKSTTIANLAISFSRAGRSTILVDLDLRRPFISKLFGLTGHPGITDVALGSSHVDDALAPIDVFDIAEEPDSAELPPLYTRDPDDNVRVPPLVWRSLLDVSPLLPREVAEGSIDGGLLRVLTSGPVPPDPGEFVGSRKVEAILEQLKDRADIVLIDAPPLLRVGDALTLSARVDAVIVVARLDVFRRQMINDIKRAIEASPATTLGFVSTGAEQDEGHVRGYSSYYYGGPPQKDRKRSSRLTRRA
jgi:Mrp family chromosome partitioning ATPase/capsular polysaccharide biosynthesis protein